MSERSYISNFLPDRNFGFIHNPGAEADLFFHGSALRFGRPQIGAFVEYEITEGRKGPEAIQVQVVDGTPEERRSWAIGMLPKKGVRELRDSHKRLAEAVRNFEAAVHKSGEAHPDTQRARESLLQAEFATEDLAELCRNIGAQVTGAPNEVLKTPEFHELEAKSAAPRPEQKPKPVRPIPPVGPTPEKLESDLQRFIRNYINRPADSWLNAIRKRAEDPHLSPNRQAFYQHCVRYMLGHDPLPEDVANQLPPETWHDSAERMQHILSCHAIITAQGDFKDPVEVGRLLEAKRRLDVLQWKETQLSGSEADRDVIALGLSGLEFDGTVKSETISTGFIVSPFLGDEIMGHADNVIEGDLVKAAHCTFEVEVQLSEKYQTWKYAAKKIYSNRSRPEFLGSSCIVSELKNRAVVERLRQGLANGNLAVVFPNSKSPFLEEPVAKALDCPLDSVNPLPSGHNIYNIYSDLARHAKVVGDFDETSQGLPKAIRRSASNTFLKLVNEAEIAARKWVVVVDESGDAFDYSPKPRNAPPTVLVAVAIPPGARLAPCAPGFHSTESGDESVYATRQRLLEREDVLILAWRYESGQPSSVLDDDVVARDFHAQMWRHAVSMTLEMIGTIEAKRDERPGPVPVSIYLENVALLSTERRHLLDLHVAELAEANEARPGWSRLKLHSPVIIAKDEHPWLAYADAMGHVFRFPRPDDEHVEQQQQLRERPNTHRFAYDQDALEQMHAIILAAGKNPEVALKSVLTMTEATISNYRVLLVPLARTALERLDARAAQDLVNTLESSLSKRPDRYAGAELLCQEIAKQAGLLEAFGPTVRFMAHLNHLASLNHAGDIDGGEEVASTLQELTKEVAAPDLRYRFYALLGDLRANALDIEGAFEAVAPHIDEARGDLGRVETSGHLLGHHMQLLAFDGQLEAALAVSGDLAEHQRTPSDRERHQVYRAHLLYELGDGDGAWQAAEDAGRLGYGDSLVRTCASSKYLLCLVLKLQARFPRLAEATVRELVDTIDAPLVPSFPWSNIAYWATQCLKAMGQPNEELVKGLCGNLALEASGPAVLLINSCLVDQLRADGHGDALRAELGIEGARAGLGPAGQRWLERHPQRPDIPYGYLAPLRFNYL